jgi:hypothetical protein
MGTKRSIADGPGRPRWENLADDELLQMRFSALRLRLEDSANRPEVERTHAELARRGIQFRPHVPRVVVVHVAT